MGNKPQNNLNPTTNTTANQNQQGVIVTNVQQNNQKEVKIQIQVNELEEEFLKHVSQENRKKKWSEIFRELGIKDMNGLIQAYRLDRNSIIGKKCNEAENMILKNYILQRNNERDVKLEEIEFKNDNIDKNNQIDIKNILVLGITGQGKTTFINSFVTYLKGFNQKDSYLNFPQRYYVAKTRTHQAQSDTQEVNSYQILYEKLDGSGKILFNLIDTPGLADTEGFAADQKRIEQISQELEKLKKNNQRLHAVLIVSQSSTQYEVLNGEKSLLQMAMLNILKLFGKSMSGFTTHILSFSDFTITNYLNFESAESIFHALTMEQMHLAGTQNNNEILNTKTFHNLLGQENQQPKPFQQYVQFQNSVFKANKIGFIERIQIKKNIDNYYELVNKLLESKGFELAETEQVIKQRKEIKKQEQDAQIKLANLLKFRRIITDSLKKIEIFQNKYNDSKDYEYIEYVTECLRQENKVGKFFTNCLNCDLTCCNECKVTNANIEHCNSMINNICSKCGCSVKQHVNEKHKWIFRQKPIKKVDENLEKENKYSLKQLEIIQDVKKSNEREKQSIEAEIKEVLNTLKKCLEEILSSALYNFDLLEEEVIGYIEKCYPQFKGALSELVSERKQQYQVKPELKEQARIKYLKSRQTTFQRTTTQLL